MRCVARLMNHAITKLQDFPVQHTFIGQTPFPPALHPGLQSGKGNTQKKCLGFGPTRRKAPRLCGLAYAETTLGKPYTVCTELWRGARSLFVLLTRAAPSLISLTYIRSYSVKTNWRAPRVNMTALGSLGGWFTFKRWMRVYHVPGTTYTVPVLFVKKGRRNGHELETVGRTCIEKGLWQVHLLLKYHKILQNVSIQYPCMP